SGKMILASEVFSLSDVIDRVFVGIKSLCENKNQTVEVKWSGIDSDALVGDQMRLRQMLINLLTNATKYTPEGGHIFFEISKKPSNVQRYVHLTFTIADNGIGMTEEYLEHLFEPFHMEGRSSVQGTGLGMPIVKNIVTMLNGDIHVQSAVDEGTVFTVSLDLMRASEDEESLLVADAPASKLPATPDGKGGWKAVDLTGVRVLLAEDNDLNAEIAKELLIDAGLQVEWAENGEQACKMFDESEPGYYDLILMDIQMPIMNGCEAARSIRALDRSDAEAIPIIAMSANAFMEDVETSLRCGMDAHLSKPIDMAQVLATVAEEIAKKGNNSQA
ncbi:MAG: ATP-binding protein, partial [Raoultibacter sp.]